MGRKSEIGESWGIAMTLMEKPLTVEGIMEQFHAFTRRFGFFGSFYSESVHRGVDFGQWLRDHLDELEDMGWVVRKGETYTLTGKGRKAAGKALAEVEKTRDRLAGLATPENASKLTLIVHLFLAAVKLPAGILSGSVALLNDAVDTLLDGISSLMVYWGLRVRRERLVSRLLVLFMLATGAFALVEAVLRILHREPAVPFESPSPCLSAGEHSSPCIGWPPPTYYPACPPLRCGTPSTSLCCRSPVFNSPCSTCSTWPRASSWSRRRQSACP